MLSILASKRSRRAATPCPSCLAHREHASDAHCDSLHRKSLCRDSSGCDSSGCESSDFKRTTVWLRGSTALALVAFFSCGASADDAIDPEYIEQHLDNWVSLYRELHAAPELSFRENKTTAKLATRLQANEIAVTTGIGKTGYVGVIKNGSGPVLMLRTDLDGLPVTELSGLEYASRSRATDARGVEVGVMHACAHDIHMTCQVAAAEYLVTHREQWRGTLLLFGQPAEEIGGGASAMIADGALVRFPRPDFAVALHVDSEMPTGSVGFRAGNLMASVDSVDIVVHGKGGHGAFPQNAIDPVVQAAHLILDLQSLVSRENNPLDPAVITVGSIHAGTKHNIIDSNCKLQLTVRSYSPEVRQRLLDGIARKAKAAALSAGAAEPTIEFSDYTPATINDSALVQQLVPAYRKTFGTEKVIDVPPVMGGEDFSQFGLAGIPIAMFRIGTQSPDKIAAFAKEGKSLPSLHSPFFYPEPVETIRTGTKTLIATALELLPPE
jgi:amidohydrolase